MGAHHAIAPKAQDTPHFPPMQEPLLVDERGNAWLPHPFAPGMRILAPLCEGLAVAWTPASMTHVVLTLWGGNPDNPSDESIGALLRQPGLKRLIADLQSIDRQIDSQMDGA